MVAAATGIRCRLPCALLPRGRTSRCRGTNRSLSPSPSFPFSHLYYRRSTLPPASSPSSPGPSDSLDPQIALLLEVEGVIADVYRFGNRHAFNLAFRKLGLDCASWPEPVYTDLLRRAGGDEERMLTLFFNQIGWPTSLPTNEKESFLKCLLKEKLIALEEFSASASLPLRPGVDEFIDDALNGGIPVLMLTTYGRNGERTARSIVQKLGEERVSRMKVIGKEEVERSLFGQLFLGKGLTSGLDEQLANEARRAASMEKQRVASEVASILKLSVDIDTTPSDSLQMITATLRAGAEYASLPVTSCILITGSQSGLVVAERIGMPCVVVRSSLTARAEFLSASLVADGFGGADLTVSKLLSRKWS